MRQNLLPPFLLFGCQVNTMPLHLLASCCLSFSAMAALQNADTFKQRLLFSRSSAWWSCWASPSELGWFFWTGPIVNL